MFAMVPAGQAAHDRPDRRHGGCFGNVGAVTYLTVLSFVDTSTFFMIIAASAAICFVIVQFLDEPSGQMRKLLPDGTAQLIDVA